MRPAPFELLRPRTIGDALDALRDEEARPLAGGQSLLALMNLRLATPERLVDLAQLEGLDGVRSSDGSLVIGAMARQAAVEIDPMVRKVAPLISEALGHVGHWQIRTRGTIGGNLAHADPASELPAVMLVLDATYRVRGPAGERRLAASDFVLGPYTTALEAGELLTAVEIPHRAPGDTAALVEITRVPGAYAMAGIAVWCRMADGVVDAARLATFAAGPRAVRITEAERLLAGRPIGQADIDSVSRVVEATADGHDDVHVTRSQRGHLLGVAAARALATVRRRASEQR